MALDGYGDSDAEEVSTHAACVIVMGEFVSAGTVIRPTAGSETTAGRVGTVYSATVRDPLSTMILMTVATTVVTV
jgi:hypothetical protein